MRRILFLFLILGIFATGSFAQKRKIIKPKPEEESNQPSTESILRSRRRAVLRTKMPVQPKSHLTGVTVSTFSNEFLGFGGTYHFRQNHPISWTLYALYYPVPSDQFYFDPYYWEFYQRNSGSIFLMAVGLKYRLPFMKDEPNIHPYWVAGAGPVLGVQYDLSRSFPGSWTHAFSVGGMTGYTGFGVEYYFGEWVLGGDLRFQTIYFPRRIFSKKEYNALAITFNFGKMF